MDEEKSYPVCDLRIDGGERDQILLVEISTDKTLLRLQCNGVVIGVFTKDTIERFIVDMREVADTMKDTKDQRKQ